MITRLQALQTGRKMYNSTCKEARPDETTHRHRWTGSGKCVDCYPRARGTMVQAMHDLFGVNRPLPLEEAQAQGLPVFRATCKRGHNSWRYVKTPLICLECVKIARRREKPSKSFITHATIAQPIDSSFPAGMTLEIAQALGLPLDKLY